MLKPMARRILQSSPRMYALRQHLDVIPALAPNARALSVTLRRIPGLTLHSRRTHGGVRLLGFSPSPIPLSSKRLTKSYGRKQGNP